MDMWHVAVWDGKFDMPVTYHGRIPVIQGKTMEIDGYPMMYHKGFHASPSLLYSLLYSPPLPGICIQNVSLGGVVYKEYDGIIQVAQSRRCNWILGKDETQKLLQGYLNRLVGMLAHVWEPPLVVRRYLESGESADAACKALRTVATNPYDAPMSVYGLVRRAVFHARTERPGMEVRIASEKAAESIAISRYGKFGTRQSDKVRSEFAAEMKRMETMLCDMANAAWHGAQYAPRQTETIDTDTVVW